MLRASSLVPPVAQRLLRTQRVGILGHRCVGKTTLLSMIYREAAAGRLGSCRLAAADAPTATYLSDKIQQLEAGERVPGTLAETDLNLNLYQGASRIPLTFKDYQGEHVELGREEAIHPFLRDCDAVWLCVDVSALSATGLLRRQQEFEQLIESYLASEPSSSVSRPFALLLTKADLLGNAAGRLSNDWVEALAMTRHTLETHCPNHGLFAVSSLEQEVDVPGFRLLPRNLDEPLAWLATSLQAQDEARLESLWATQPRNGALLVRALTAFARRYPDAPVVAAYRQRLRLLRWQLLRRRGLFGIATAACVALAVAGYDALGYHQTTQFETQNREDPNAVLTEWENYRHWHPTRHLLQPDVGLAEQQHVKELETAVRRRACEQKLADLSLRLETPDVDVEALWQDVVSFRAQFPEAARADWEPLQARITQQRAALRARKAHQAYEELLHAERRASDLPALLVLADRFLRDHPGSEEETKVRGRRADYLARIDLRDIEEARSYSRLHPLYFQTRKERYQGYLDRHVVGGAFVQEAEKALKEIDASWDRHDFRAIRDHFEHSPGDVPNLVARCRAYLGAHPRGAFTDSARELLRWSERVSTTRDYRVTLKRGRFDKKVARFFSLGPDLSVELEVKGVRYGPSTIVRNQYSPEWDFEFPRPIRWKLGDPVKIYVTDHDWGDRVVAAFESEDNDPLAMKLLWGETTLGNQSLTFECDFTMPVLPRIE